MNEISYEQFLEELNGYLIEEMTFSVKCYGHYRHCTVKVTRDTFCNGEPFNLITFLLTRDRSEEFRFLNKFNESTRLFNLGRKGKFTLKELWKEIEILNIKRF